ncbi:M20 peptidase aminoacylase family protein [Evansella sp. AB-rgal1]|uniref:M20 peptidase aminoacylase family protein n=1 Tax=Evansella sp. AB-rgal1 TaxID=3242696 RepID=UPI00359F0C89
MIINLKDIEQEITRVFEYLHENPETSWKEYNTTKYIAEFLREQGISVRTFDNIPGLIAEIGEGSPMVAVRADMDALWQEVDGTFKANHSCGHDAHMAIVCGVAMALKGITPPPKGTVRFIFQPAEEKGTGALHLVEEGVVDDVNYLYGIHLRPIQELEDGKAVPSIIHGAAKIMQGKITADDAHAARPHLGKNAIEVGAQMITMLNSIHLNPMESYSVKMTSFHAGGESANIIPGSATFSIDLRAQRNEVMDELTEKVEQIAGSLQSYYNIGIELTETASIAAAQVHEEAQAFMEKAIIHVIGEANLREPLITTGGDDFHFYTIKRPHLKAAMLGLGCGLAPGLHHPKMTFNKDAMINGVKILSEVVINTLEERAEQR